MIKIILFITLTTFVVCIQAQSPPQIKSTKNATSAKPVASAATSSLTGIFYAPSGVGIVLQNNGKNDLSISPKKENGKAFTITNFIFPAYFSMLQNQRLFL